ncbi:MAG TPA: hypothetical protein VGM05_09315 [Planctomycetaceae bacterium]
MPTQISEAGCIIFLHVFSMRGYNLAMNAMDPTTCVNCGTYVIPMADGSCPACQRPANAAVAPAGASDGSQLESQASKSARQALLEPESSSHAAHRPKGLVVLAVLQFVFAAASLLSLFMAIGSPTMQAEMQRQGVTMDAYTILSLLGTFLLLIASGAGYLSQNRILGYWGGNLLAIGLIANIMIHNFQEHFARFSRHIPSLFYPIVLLFVLNVHFRKEFR